jgi:hypothetical protein
MCALTDEPLTRKHDDLHHCSSTLLPLLYAPMQFNQLLAHTMLSQQMYKGRLCMQMYAQHIHVQCCQQQSDECCQHTFTSLLPRLPFVAPYACFSTCYMHACIHTVHIHIHTLHINRLFLIGTYLSNICSLPKSCIYLAHIISSYI